MLIKGDDRGSSDAEGYEDLIMLSTPLGRLRVIGWVEGMSFLVLLFVAMPLKYLAGRPEAVFGVGLAHGVLWTLYVASAAEVTFRQAWPARTRLPAFWRRLPAPWLSAAIIASVLPAGPFLLEPRLRPDDPQLKPSAS